MKIFLAITSLIATVVAELPPSHSYLPPPPARSTQGYPRGGPKSQGLEPVEPTGNPFGRPAKDPLSQAKFGVEEGYDRNASPFGRNGLDDAIGVSSEPVNYNFGYSVNDVYEGTDFGHHEERKYGRSEGVYHVVLPDGRRQTVKYEADERGFKSRVSYEDPGSPSGYDANASNPKGYGGRTGNGNHGNGRHGNERHANGKHNHGNPGNGSGSGGRAKGYRETDY